jgi:hypothetical protein
MNVSGDYHNDPNWLAQQPQQVIENLRAKYKLERQIALQSVVGGPNGSLCPSSDPQASQPWWLAGPYDHLTSNNVTFNGSRTSASFTFVSPRQLISIDADNGGLLANTVTLSCAGQVPKVVTLARGQLTTSQTGWTGTCSSVTISITGTLGVSTNFDNLVVQ